LSTVHCPSIPPGYKQTEVGVIPEEWEVRTLGKCLIERPSYGINAAAVPYSDNLPVYIRITDISDDGRFLPDKLVSVKSELSVNYYLSEGDIVFARTGASVGKSYRYDPNDGPLVFAGFLIRVRPDVERLLPEFAAAYVTTGNYWRWVRIMSMRSGQPGINGNEYSQLPIPVPPLPEQRAIAEALSDVDGLLGGLDRLIAKKRDLKQAAMQQLLTGQTRLPGFHGEWEVKTIDDIVEKIVGGGTPSRANPAFWGNEIPWITVKDFATFNPLLSQESITQLGLRNSASHLIPAGTLITSTRMALGKAVVYAVDVAINQDLKALFLKPGTSVAFLTYWFEHFGGLIDELGSGSTVKGISLVELRRFPFRAPPLPEQTAIAEVLTDMDAELAALELRREKTRALKQAMMQELLTGRTRLV
jgi:type I restriction enzyme S subunit